MATLIADQPNEKAKRKTADGDKTLNTKSREFVHKTSSLENLIAYELRAKINNGVKSEGRANYFRTNASLESLPLESMSEEEKEEAIIKLSKDIAASFTDNFLELSNPADVAKFLVNQALNGSTKEDRKQIQKAYLAYSYVISLHADEAKGLTEEEKANLLHDMNEYFIKKITNNKEINSLYTAAVHFNTEKPHLHGKLASIDFNGKKLNLQDNYLRIQQILIEMECHPKFGKHLMKISTLAAEKKQRPDYDDKISLEKTINSCFSKEIFNFKETHQLLKDNKIVLKPTHEGKLKKIIISRKGSKDIDYKHLDTKVKVGIQRYIELKRIQDNHSKYPLGDKLTELRNLVLENKDSSKDVLLAALEANGYELIVNKTKNGVINGLSVKIKDIDETIKMSTLGITKNDLTSLHIDLKTGQKMEMYQGADGIMIIDSNGNHRLLHRTKPKNTSAFCFMPESGWHYDILLQSHYTFSDKSFSNRYGKQKFKIVEQDIDSGRLQVAFRGTTSSDAKAVIQLYLVNGFKGLEITATGTSTQSQELWRQGQILGAYIGGYTPTNEDLAWLKKQKEEAIEQTRQKNLTAICAYADTKKPFTLKVVSNQWMEIDRRPIALAFVDLLKNGLPPTLVLNPPRKGGKSGTEDDLREFYHFILSTVAKEAPQLLEAATKELEAYKPKELTIEKVEPTKPSTPLNTGLYAELEEKEREKPKVNNELSNDKFINIKKPK